MLFVRHNKITFGLYELDRKPIKGYDDLPEQFTYFDLAPARVL